LDFDGDKVDSSPKGDKGLSLTPTTSVSDPMVVDARNVPTGLPKSVADAIPQTPAGDRVRKGFEAIQTHDWKVALAWFQDALNHEPGDPGLQRLVDLAQFTMQRESQPATIVGPDEDLKDGLNDFDKNYVPIHPDSPFPKVTITTPAETEQEQLKESELKSQTTAVAPTGSDAADGKRKAGDDFSNLKRNTPIKDSPYETTMSDEEWFKQGNDSAFKRWMDARDNVKRENETPEGLFNERENSSWRNFFRLLTHKTEDEPIRIDANGIRD